MIIPKSVWKTHFFSLCLHGPKEKKYKKDGLPWDWPVEKIDKKALKRSLKRKKIDCLP
jgi:hypothetical protein